MDAGKADLHKTLSSNHHDDATACRTTVCHPAITPGGASWLPFRLLPQALPCKVVGPSLHEIDISKPRGQHRECRRHYSRILDKGCEWSKPDRSMKRSMQAPSLRNPFPDALLGCWNCA